MQQDKRGIEYIKDGDSTWHLVCQTSKREEPTKTCSLVIALHDIIIIIKVGNLLGKQILHID